MVLSPSDETPEETEDRIRIHVLGFIGDAPTSTGSPPRKRIPSTTVDDNTQTNNTQTKNGDGDIRQRLPKVDEHSSDTKRSHHNRLADPSGVDPSNASFDNKHYLRILGIALVSAMLVIAIPSKRGGT